MISSIFRKKNVDEQFLRHSEWARRLGIPLIISLAGIKSLSMMLFIILPFSLTQLAGPSTVFSLIIAFLITFLTSAHLSELSCLMPKNCVQYQFAYSVLGEFPAFLIGWFSLFDYLSQASLFCRSWGEHFNLLFCGLPSKTMWIHTFSNESIILSPKIDLLSILSAIFTLFILLCSLRVVGTICVSLLAITLLISASCSMVAFFHLNPENWLKADFFTFGYQGVLYSICALCACYTGIESTSCLLEETKNPRKRISTILSFLSVALTTIFFIFSMVFSLSTNVTALDDSTMIPQIFTVLNIPAAKSITINEPKSIMVKRYPFFITSTTSSSSSSNMSTFTFRSYYESGFIRMRYMLSVCSVCALSGGVLASFLPATRVIATLCHDCLIPYSKDSSIKSPYFAVLLCTILVSLGTFIQKKILLNYVIFMAPIKLSITIILTFLQHYLQNQVGIPEETSSYKSIGKKRIEIKIDDETSIEDSTQRSDDSSIFSQSTFDTTAFLYLAATKVESERLQKKLEKEQMEAEKKHFLPKSVSNYNTINKPKNESKYHNCVAEQCRNQNEDVDSGNLHLFCSDEPEVPFFTSSTSTPQSEFSSSNFVSNFRKSLFLLILFLTTTVLLSFTIRFTNYSEMGRIFSGIFLLLLIGIVLMINKIQTNDHLQKRTSHVPLFPFLSLFPLFLLISAFTGSVPVFTLKHMGISVLFGIFIYFIYGYWNSKQRFSKIIQAKNLNSSSDQYDPIIGNNNDTCSEM